MSRTLGPRQPQGQPRVVTERHDRTRVTRLGPVGRYWLAAGTLGAAATWGSENLFWSAPPAGWTPLELAVTWVVYSLCVAAALSAVLWSGVQGWRAVFLGGAVLGWLIEGVVVATMYAAFPFQVVWTPLAWHALITGLVVVGDLVGEGPAQEHAVVGDTPNLAARLQGASAPMGIVVSEETRRQIGEAFTLESLGALALKGFARPVEAWRVLGEAQRQSRFRALRPHALADLVGTSRETTTKVLGDLAERELISLRRGRIVIRNRPALTTLADDGLDVALGGYRSETPAAQIP